MVEACLLYVSFSLRFAFPNNKTEFRCQDMPKVSVNGKETDFCSKACAEDSVRAGSRASSFLPYLSSYGGLQRLSSLKSRIIIRRTRMASGAILVLDISRT
jgi:hypothetical protein